jgi:flagellar hook assembly protein FlgD
MVNIIQMHDLSAGYRTPPLRWDGTDASGNKLNPGIYLYQVQASTKSGKFAQGNGKLLIVQSK